jgi:hypothetical protein
MKQLLHLAHLGNRKFLVRLVGVFLTRIIQSRVFLVFPFLYTFRVCQVGDKDREILQ